MSQHLVIAVSDILFNRYGYSTGSKPLATDAMVAAWQLLLHSVYNAGDHWGVTKSVIEKRPSLNRAAVVTDGFQGVVLHYNACDIVESWRLLLPAAQQAEPGSSLEIDLIDITRQV